MHMIGNKVRYVDNFIVCLYPYINYSILVHNYIISIMVTGPDHLYQSINLLTVVFKYVSSSMHLTKFAYQLTNNTVTF